MASVTEFSATPEVVDEYASTFMHYDKEKNGILDYAEFTHMMRALGFEIPLEAVDEPGTEFQRILDIVDPERKGHITLRNYVNFMIQEDAN